MPVPLPFTPAPPSANDITALVAGMRSCLALADRLDLPMVGIHLEQARSWLIAHGYDEA